MFFTEKVTVGRAFGAAPVTPRRSNTTPGSDCENRAIVCAPMIDASNSSSPCGVWQFAHWLSLVCGKSTCPTPVAKFTSSWHDPHAARLDIARRLGAQATIHIERSWSDEYSSIEREFEVAIDATGTVGGWSTALAATLPGGTTLFFGGCAPADRIEVSTFPIHYDELSLLGSYHHTPRSFRVALDRLAAARSDFRLLLSYEESLPNVEAALRAMLDRQALKVVIRPG